MGGTAKEELRQVDERDVEDRERVVWDYGWERVGVEGERSGVYLSIVGSGWAPL